MLNPQPLSRRRLLALTLALFNLLPIFRISLAAPAGPERWEKAIQTFEAADKTNPPPKDATLFVGGSNIRRWTNVADYFPGTKVINRGFGGARLADVAHFADRIVIPYAPKTIYLNAGGNDLSAGKTPEQIRDSCRDFVQKVRAALPQTRIFCIAIPPTPSGLKRGGLPLIKSMNRLLEAYAREDGKLGFIDIYRHLIGRNEQGRPELFVSDGTHFNPQGCELVTSVIRWQDEINALLAKEKNSPPPANEVLFLGSSSIRRWTNLVSDFPNYQVINHGFGGSQIIDSVVFADDLVLPCAPRLIVFYAGGNDINAGKTPERVLADFQAFAKKVHDHLPGTRIACISIAGNPKRWAQIEQVRQANRLIEAFTRTDPRLQFINVFTAMLGADGLPLPDIFVEDNLHMNARGYAIWTKIVEPYLKK